MDRRNRAEIVAQLEQNHGRIFAPDGTWLDIQHPMLSAYDGDIWSGSLAYLRSPFFEQDFAIFLESAVNAELCSSSGEARVNLICENTSELAAGDLFDFNNHYVDRSLNLLSFKSEFMPCSTLGKSARSTMNKLRIRAFYPRTVLAQKRHYIRMCVYSWSWRNVLARAGYREYCTLHAA